MLLTFFITKQSCGSYFMSLLASPFANFHEFIFFGKLLLLFFGAELEVAKLREVARLVINAHKDN